MSDQFEMADWLAFTREELEDIRNCILVYDDFRESPAYKELLIKVQAMIDSYPKQP